MRPSSPAGLNPPPDDRSAHSAVKAEQYAAFIGDIVLSTQIAGTARRDLQYRIERSLSRVNERFSKALAAKFVITTGDEFQGLLKDPSVIPAIIRMIEMGLSRVEFRVGIGHGSLETDLREFAVGMDGPAWHAARNGIVAAERDGRLGGVFVGFGNVEDQLLSAFARVLHHMRKRLTVKQRVLLEELLENDTQKDVAEKMGISKQVVSKQARAAGWDVYREVEEAWRIALRLAGPYL